MRKVDLESIRAIQDALRKLDLPCDFDLMFVRLPDGTRQPVLVVVFPSRRVLRGEAT